MKCLGLRLLLVSVAWLSSFELSAYIDHADTLNLNSNDGEEAGLAANNEHKQSPRKVEIKKDPAGEYAFYIDDELFVLKGVGMGQATEAKAKALVAAGGNAFRTWSMDKLSSDLAIAEKYGLMVAVGIATGKELLGFDYNNNKAVEAQYQSVIKKIAQYKNHPNILIWVVGNEPNLVFDEDQKLIEANPKVYDALGDIIDYIHLDDPMHPATFALAGARAHQLRLVLDKVPNIDVLAVQLYGDIVDLQNVIQEIGADKPYMVTEFGPLGHWEMPSTDWGREIEQVSGVKAQGMSKRMQTHIINDTSGQVLGGFAFFWGQKQERTPTWYGMFNETGEQNARIDEISKLWLGVYPENRAPNTQKITLNGKEAVQSVKLKVGSSVSAEVFVSDPNNDSMTTTWVMMDEVQTRSQGGHFEARPKELKIDVRSTSSDDEKSILNFVVPSTPGEYRLFAYTRDGKGKIGNANIPFLVIRD